MKFSLVLVLSMTLCSVSLSQQLTRSEESPDAETCKGKQGIPGEAGSYGYPGDKGEKGQPASSLTRPPLGTPCLCPPGPEGSEGPIGEPGPQGMKGLKGLKGYPGGKGDVGSRGSPGFSGPPGSLQSPHPPSKPDTMYVPVVIKKKLPPVICHHFRRHSYVPGVPNNWLGWYEAGKSGFSSYNKWVYYMSQFTCPCSIAVPPPPTPSVDEILRRL